MKKSIMLTAAALLFSAATAHAIPSLQLYLAGGSYDAATETWTTNTNHFSLWVIGSGVPVYGVYLSAAYNSSEHGTITLTPTTAAAMIDPSLPGAPTPAASGIGTVPTMGDGANLPAHGIYGAGTSWQSWLLGDFAGKDSKVGDFIGSFPNTLDADGQINAYTVDITGYSSVHFDAYDHVVARGNGRFHSAESINSEFAPFSHDSEGGSPVPEPGTSLLMGCGLFALAVYGKRRQKA